MKKLYLLVLIVLLYTCQSAPAADKAKTGDGLSVTPPDGVLYTTDSSQVINFIGTKPVGQHQGSFNIIEGKIYLKNDVLVSGGKFIFDINSLKINDPDTSDTAKLRNHLLSADFFDAANNPEAVFEITSVEPFSADSAKVTFVLDNATDLVNGNLTLRGVTKNVTFPAVVTIQGNTIGVQANFNINRTDWGMLYRSDKSFGDQFIRPEVNISFDIKTTKAEDTEARD